MRSLLLLLLLPFSVCAQKYELTIGGGVGTNTFNNSPYKNSPGYSGSSKTVNPVFLLAFNRNITSHIQIGIQVAPTVLSYKEKINIPGYNEVIFHYTFANPALPVLFTGNYKFGSFYAGVGLGCIVPVYREFNNTKSGEFYAYFKSNPAFVWNLHAGYKKWFSPRWGIDIAASYNSCKLAGSEIPTLTGSQSYDVGKVVYYNCTIGVCRKFGK